MADTVSMSFFKYKVGPFYPLNIEEKVPLVMFVVTCTEIVRISDTLAEVVTLLSEVTSYQLSSTSSRYTLSISSCCPISSNVFR